MDKQPSSRTCFLCGRQNDAGLKVSWYNDRAAGKVKATVVVPEHFNGYPGIVHGGIVAALLDETAGRAVLVHGGDDDLMVTLKLEVKYRRPTPTGEPLTVVGWVLQHAAGSARVAGQILLADGTVTAQCEAVLVRAPQEFFQRWAPEKPFWRVYED